MCKSMTIYSPVSSLYHVLHNASGGVGNRTPVTFCNTVPEIISLSLSPPINKDGRCTPEERRTRGETHRPKLATFHSNYDITNHCYLLFFKKERHSVSSLPNTSSGLLKFHNVIQLSYHLYQT